MICFPNAKINLGLHIVSKREDGYHNIETVFYPIPLCDVLEIVPSRNGETTFTQTGMQIEGRPDDNLVMKAYHLFGENAKTVPEVDIYLRKNIPFGAGLGGGSSDAAFMLKLLNDYTKSSFSNDELEAMASQIGADCAFFINNKPVFAEGIGTDFTPIDISLVGYYILLIKPNVHVSTKEAYALVEPRKPQLSIRDILNRPIGEWKDLLCNDFESSIFAQYPEIESVKTGLYQKGALYASMSGSGSSVFGIFDTLPTDIPEGSYLLQIKE